MTAPTTAYIGLGSNLGDRLTNIRRSIEMLAAKSGIDLVAESDIIETAPLIGLDQPGYLNAAVQVDTTLEAALLLKEMQKIEWALGRTVGERWASRVIDLDLLLFGQQIINKPELTVPHRQMHLRSFVLRGLCQLDGTLAHPVLKESVTVLARRLSGADFALDSKAPQFVSIAGNIGVGKTTLARTLAEKLNCSFICEPYDTNPYMPDVYAGKKELALDSQLYFLNSRIQQLNQNALKPGQLYVSDYVFDKEPVYAGLTLSRQQLAEYQRSYDISVSQICKPVLVIFLTDTIENCLARIHKRNRPYEQKIRPVFLKELADGYERLFADWKICPVIRIVMSEFDCGSKQAVEHLALQVKYYSAD